LWIAAVVSFTGSWMQNVGAGWLMAALTGSPLMVGLVQAANSLPVFLVVLPAGALADTVDRRRLLIATQLWMVGASAALGVLTMFGLTTPWVLIAFTFLLGIGAVMNDPAWQAITPEIVDQDHLAPAIALNSAGFNVARAVGPALGGFVVAAWGAGSAFLINAASFFGVVGFLLRWKRRPHEPPIQAQRVLQSISTGWQYIRHTRPAQSVLIRTGAFSVFAAALWALLPLIAPQHGSIGYGMLLACLGLGAVIGAAVLPLFRRAFSLNAIVIFATVLYAVVTAAAGRIQQFGVLCAVLIVGGAAWLGILASLNYCAQTMSPGWLRARSLSMYLLILQGGMAAGSAIWGAVAERIGIANALVGAAVGMLIGVGFLGHHRLDEREPLDAVIAEVK
jgi:MFS family permease